METPEVDFKFLAPLLHSHSYALMKAVAGSMGRAGAVLMEKYAEALMDLLEVAGLDFRDFTSFRDALVGSGLVRDCDLKILDDSLEFTVEGCALAELTHEKLHVEGYREYICPLASIAMVVLARKMGYRKGENLFNYITFHENLTYFKPTGSKTKFKVLKRIV